MPGCARGNLKPSLYEVILLMTFVQRVLPCLEEPFVLLTGDSDLTLPRQVDLRFQRILEPALWDQLLQDPRVLHMYLAG